MTHSAKDARGGHNGHYWKESAFRKRFNRREARRECRQIVRQATISWYADLWDDHLAQLKLDVEEDNYVAHDPWHDEWERMYWEDVANGLFDEPLDLVDDYYEDPFMDDSDHLFLSHAPELRDVPTVDLLAEIDRRRMATESCIDSTPTVHYAISGRDESLGAILQRALDHVKPIGEH